ncbi:syntaxin-binding protein 5-like, partial [Tachysurus ichikawai]
TVRHGFPYQPTALAFDPVQKILAIGSRTGGVRMYPFPLGFLSIVLFWAL